MADHGKGPQVAQRNKGMRMTDLDLYAMATRAVVGPTQGEVAARVFEALDLTKRRAHAEAYEMGFHDGYANAMDVMRGDAQPEERLPGWFPWMGHHNPEGC